MKPGIPWSVKGIEPEVREAAKHAAKRAGMTLGEWLNTVILDQSDDLQPTEAAPESPPREEFFRREPERAPPRREETTIRLEDIAQQLSQLAQRERESASILPYEPPRGRDQDRETLNRILNRIDSNERQAVEAFTAVNERLSVLGRQIAMSAKAPVFEKPEDVPGYAALEGAIRNVVEHIEVSEKRTRDGLKSMQDRLSEMAERATQPTNPDDLVRAAPAFASLEGRLAEMASRIQRSENMLQTGLPDVVRTEISQLADRIEGVRASAERLAGEATTSAASLARGELREIESRILGVLKEAQATIGSQQASASDLHRLRADIGTINRRIDEFKAGSATDRDVQALRVAVEQLSTRVAQGADMRPLADMDRRLGELSSRLELNHQAARNLPQFGELERRIAELDHRLEEAMRLQGDHEALAALQDQIAAVDDRVGRTEQQLGHLETMERAIGQLFESLEQNRSMMGQTAEDAATRAVERVLATQQHAGPSNELRALEDGLRAVRESAAGAEQRNQETLEAVHETLEQIVNKLAELETSTAGHQVAAAMAQQAAEHVPAWQQAAVLQPVPEVHAEDEPAQPQFFDPTGAFNQAYGNAHQNADHAEPDAHAEPELAFAPEPPAEDPVQHAHTAEPAGNPAVAGDDFIAAARRAAQAAAASRPSVLHPAVKPDMKPGANRGFSFKLPFTRSKPEQKPITFVGGKPVEEPPKAANDTSRRRKLVLAGIVLLAAVSAFAFNMISKSAKPVKQTNVIEQQVEPGSSLMSALPAQQQPLQTATPAADLGDDGEIEADMLPTGALPAKKSDATLMSIVAEPGTFAANAELPPPEAGTQALRDAAQRGDPKAQFIIAGRYLDGQSVAQDLPKAAYWYQQAASRGLAPAQYRLATLFERGKGVPQDVATALLWYERAATGGNIKSMHNAAVIAAGNQAGTPNYDVAFKWFKAAAEHGLHDSQFNLAVLYERGLGTKVDKAEAYFWYAMAGSQGDTDATKRADAMAKSLPASETDAVMQRIASFTPKTQIDDANVVAVTDPVWDGAGEPAAPAEVSVAPSSAADPVEEAQSLLTRLGFNVGTPDGKLGSRTVNAIRLFQLQSGLKVTGEVSPELLDAMRSKAI